MQIKTIAIVGGTGFVGTHLANRLTRDHYRIRALTRRREAHRDLLVLPTLELVETDVHDSAALSSALAGCDAVINLAGILNERGDDGRGFRRVHVDIPRHLVQVCRALGIRRYLHMSALNAAPGAPSHYLASKGEGEELVHTASDGVMVTSFRPSVIFGPGDSFYTRFARLLALTPFVFPLACANARFAPVYVGDVVEAFARAMTDPVTAGQRYDLCGPDVYTLRQIVEYTAWVTGLERRVITLGDGLSRLQAAVFEWVPGKPFSRDNYRSATLDSVCGGDDGLRRLGIEPTGTEAVVPTYLGAASQRARYSSYRGLARRR